MKVTQEELENIIAYILYIVDNNIKEKNKIMLDDLFDLLNGKTYEYENGGKQELKLRVYNPTKVSKTNKMHIVFLLNDIVIENSVDMKKISLSDSSTSYEDEVRYFIKTYFLEKDEAFLLTIPYVNEYESKYDKVKHRLMKRFILDTDYDRLFESKMRLIGVMSARKELHNKINQLKNLSISCETSKMKIDIDELRRNLIEDLKELNKIYYDEKLRHCELDEIYTRKNLNKRFN